MSFTIAPIRLIFFLIFLILAWILASIALAGRKEISDEPMTGWRKGMRYPVNFLGRVAFFWFGFHWVTVKGIRPKPEEASVLIVAPHTSFFDVLSAMIFRLPSGVSRVENAKAKVFGTLTLFTQPVLVTRDDPDSRVKTIQEIQRRARSGGKWPQIVVFPEGTCTNGTCLISFKPGGFYPGVPVQPVVLRYRNKLNSYIWTWQGPGALKLLWYTLCQFHNQFEIEYLPIYHPNEEEKADAKLFATNVRQTMAKALGIQVTDHTYEDIRLMNYAMKLDLPGSAGLIEFAKLRKKLGMDYDNLKSLLESFCTMAQKGDGHVSLEKFAEYLGVPVSEPLREMFQLYDRDGSGSIDFREYVIGLSLVSMPANTEDTIKVAFQAFDHGGKGYITEEELAEILLNAFGMEHLDTKKIFQQIDLDQDGKIIFDEFKTYAEKRPEYAKLFTSYQDLMKEEHFEDSSSQTNLQDEKEDGAASLSGSNNTHVNEDRTSDSSEIKHAKSE